MDRLRPGQQFDQVWPELDEYIESVEGSVNKNSPHETVEEEFLCLQQFASRLMYTDGEIYKALTRDVGCTLNRMGEAMVTVGTMLREKGMGKSGPRLRGGHRLGSIFNLVFQKL